MSFNSTFKQSIYLMRLQRPIGILLLWWPTAWALWLASDGTPPLAILFVFAVGVVLMRSAGCVMNDVFDRHFDKHVTRTRERPLAVGAVSVTYAVILAGVLALLAFLLVLTCNALTIQLSFVGAFLALIYPLLKRVTHLPQLGLGVAFSWGVPMAFAAVTGEVPPSAWLVFAAAVIWPVIYDTMYAMADRADDVKIGVKSSAILFGHYDIWIIAGLMALFLGLLVVVGQVFNLNHRYYVALLVAGVLFARQWWLIRHRDPVACFRAFLQNNGVGLIIFLGILI